MPCFSSCSLPRSHHLLKACLWAIVPTFMGAEHTTWVSKFVADQQSEVSVMDLYVASLYWSIMTLTSIGYGDFVPQNTTERALCNFYMMISAGTWTYVIGTAAGIAATLDPGTVLYRVTMDQVRVLWRPERARDLPMDPFAADTHCRRSAPPLTLTAYNLRSRSPLVRRLRYPLMHPADAPDLTPPPLGVLTRVHR